MIAITAACRQAEEPPQDFEATPAAPAAERPAPLETVTASHLNVRAGPGAEHPIVGRLARGAQVRVLEETDGWKRVRPEAGGPEGWVAGGFLRSGNTY